MTREMKELLIAGAAILAGWALARRSVLPSTQYASTFALPPGVAPQHTDWLTQARAASNPVAGVALAPTQAVLSSTPIGSGYVDLSGGVNGDWLSGDDPTMIDDSTAIFM